MTALTWDQAHHHHREELKVFTCTVDATRSAATGWQDQHPRMYEFEVQQWIRGLDVPSGSVTPYRMRVGVDAGNRVRGVSYYRLVDGIEHVDLLLGAIALDYQGRGCGRGMVDDLVEAITAEAVMAAGVEEVYLEGRVHKDNVHSQNLCRWAGFEPTGTGAADVQIWTARLPIAGAEVGPS